MKRDQRKAFNAIRKGLKAHYHALSDLICGVGVTPMGKDHELLNSAISKVSGAIGDMNEMDGKERWE